MLHDKYGIYLNTKESKVMRITSPYWIPSGEEWVLLSREVNATLLESRQLAKRKMLVDDPENIVWGDWSQVTKQD